MYKCDQVYVLSALVILLSVRPRWEGPADAVGTTHLSCARRLRYSNGYFLLSTVFTDRSSINACPDRSMLFCLLLAYGHLHESDRTYFIV
jgi:hypothetical protein